VIPGADIIAWRHVAPWVSDAQVEQDLIMSRALVAIFGNEFLAGQLAFRGGTALNKLYFKPPRRYSEDIDLVQTEPGPIGPILDELQKVLNPFLGVPRRKQAEGTSTLTYRFESEGPPAVPLRLKVEINTREHFTVCGFQKVFFEVRSRWFTGSCVINTFCLEELLATKTRALYQRRKGRDLFDLWLGLTENGADPEETVRVFKQYMEKEGNAVGVLEFEKNLLDKLNHQGFTSDLTSLLIAGTAYDPTTAVVVIQNDIIARIDRKEDGL
jgi:predicted nucleotidyltransferase component of viral defense system